MTTACGASADFAFVIRQWPSSTAPFSMAMTGASMSPVTRALDSSTTCSLAVTLPTTSPRTTRVAVRTVACTTARSPMMRVSLDVISPENFASSITLPAQVYFPSISEPSSRKAPRRSRFPGALPVRLPHIFSPASLASQRRPDPLRQHQEDHGFLARERTATAREARRGSVAASGRASGMAPPETGRLQLQRKRRRAPQVREAGDQDALQGAAKGRCHQGAQAGREEVVVRADEGAEEGRGVLRPP